MKTNSKTQQVYSWNIFSRSWLLLVSGMIINMASNQQGKRPQRKRKNCNVNEDSPVIKAFYQFQQLLDTRHDKHERLVKLSRDVTIDSKRVIFMLHRVAGNEENDDLFNQAYDKFKEIQSKLMKIAEELAGEDPYQFLRAYSPGLQEYIEAVTFYHFVKSGTLISLTQLQEDLTFNISTDSSELKTVKVYIPPLEYMLGLADLTGELMRLSINSVGAGDLQLPFSVCAFIRRIFEAFLSYGNVSRELNRKVNTLRQSLNKVENACYTIQVRGSEIPKHLLVEVLSGAAADCASFVDDVSSCDI